MRISGFLAILLLLFIGILLTRVPPASSFGWGSFGFEELGSAKKVKIAVPEITLTPAEEQKLLAGKPVARLLNAPGGLKIGYLRFFAPFDPITTWMVVTNAEHFKLVDPAFPKTGSLTEKRRSYMPYVFDAATCSEDGQGKMFQLLVMPVVSPRKLSIDRFHDAAAFPYESAWTRSQAPCCQDKLDPEMKAKYFDKAVELVKNDGCWHISPLPKKYRKTGADLMRSDVIYYVDSNPGGDLSKLKAIVNKATSVALPTLMDNVLFHGKRWEQYLAKHHGPEMVKKYKAWQAAYRQAMAGK